MAAAVTWPKGLIAEVMGDSRPLTAPTSGAAAVSLDEDLRSLVCGLARRNEDRFCLKTAGMFFSVFRKAREEPTNGQETIERPTTFRIPEK